MNPNNVKKLKKKFPKLLAEIENIWCGDGWYGVVYGVCNDLQKKFPKIKLAEIKEKFGRLTVIPKSGTYPDIKKEEVWELIELHSNLSITVCEETGGMGSLRANGRDVMKTLCDSSAVLLGFYQKL